jgi:photosystem II stability/assembly factor-like uncharacterized protein
MTHSNACKIRRKLTGALTVLIVALVSSGCTVSSVQAPAAAAATATSVDSAQVTAQRWKLTAAEPFRGKQDDVFFINAQIGWYGNGSGKIYGTRDGGASWKLLFEKPGTFFRTLAFVDELHGFAGNVGTDYFPGVTDETALYETLDGGITWAAVTLPAKVKGLCAIDIVRASFINHGVLDQRTLIHAAGRVGGPANLLRSLDGGKTWKHIDLTRLAGPILDVKFFNENEGLVFAGTKTDTEQSNALILQTADGGATWREVYRSARPYEITWKASFPNRQTGFVTVQSYDPDTTKNQRVIAKTTDGGATWKEIPLVKDHAVREFGAGFATPDIGWVGINDGAFQTIDGGNSWTRIPATEIGRAVNKVRILPNGKSFIAYAIGTHVAKFEPLVAQ